eukprot:1055475-Alexandrium_andersonii.AAC.1
MGGLNLCCGLAWAAACIGRLAWAMTSAGGPASAVLAACLSLVLAWAVACVGRLATALAVCRCCPALFALACWRSATARTEACTPP